MKRRAFFDKMFKIVAPICLMAILVCVFVTICFGIADKWASIAKTRMERNTLQSRVDFKDGNYYIVKVPAGAFDSIFSGYTMIVTEDGKYVGANLYHLPDGWLIHATEIQESPDCDIELHNVKTWTWTCGHSRSGATPSGGSWGYRCCTNERWTSEGEFGTPEYKGEYVPKLVYTTEEEAVEAAIYHNEMNPGHSARAYEYPKLETD